MEMFEEDVDRHDSDRAKDSFGKHTESDETADSRGAPDGSGRGETLHRIAVLEDNTCAEETDTGDDLGNDTAVIAARYTRRHKHVERATDSDKRYRSRADHLAVQLALHTNEIP